MSFSTLVPSGHELEAALGAAFVIDVVLGALYRIGRHFRGTWDRRDPRLRVGLFLLMALVWLAGNVVAVAALGSNATVVVLLTAALFLWLLFGEFRRFWAVGIAGADIETRKGIDYKRALDLCNNRLEFLGTGASKLTGERDAFEQALRRCQRRDYPVRFLLLDLETGAEELERAASHAGIDRTAYTTKVLESLRVIAGLRRQRQWNIEVRLYRHWSEYRLMFIDDSLCLASFNVYGEGSGSQLPQLHLVARPPGHRDVESFYYPMKAYFERMWQAARPWDFAQWL